MDGQKTDTAPLTSLQKLFQPFEIVVILQRCGTTHGNLYIGEGLHAFLEQLHDFFDREFGGSGLAVGEEVFRAFRVDLGLGVLGEGAVGIGVWVVVLGDELDV